MIPELIALRGAPFKVLPPGIHLTNMEQIEAVFATNFQRQFVFGGLVKAFQDLRAARCPKMYVNGSFVSSAPQPNDFDAAWETEGVREEALNPVLLESGSDDQRLQYWGELYPVTEKLKPSMQIIEFFQKDKYTGKSKGILLLDLSVSK